MYVLVSFQIDNRGNHLVAVDDSGINTPAIAAAHVVKRYTAQAADEISLEVSYYLFPRSLKIPSESSPPAGLADGKCHSPEQRLTGPY